MHFRLGLRSRFRNARSHIRASIAGVLKLHDLAVRVKPRKDLFGEAYERQVWGSAESRSGVGSELGATEALRAYLPELFQRLGVKIFLDAPCGDWNWMQHVDLTGINYIGADVVPSVISGHQERFSRAGVRFVLADLTKDSLPRADLVMCRDCWVHLSYRDIGAILENFRRSGSTWLLVSNSPFVTKNKNQLTGLEWRHLNLQLEPFHFPPPEEAIKDHYPSVPFYISLWKIADLPPLKE